MYFTTFNFNNLKTQFLLCILMLNHLSLKRCCPAPSKHSVIRKHAQTSKCVRAKGKVVLVKVREPRGLTCSESHRWSCIGPSVAGNAQEKQRHPPN